MELNASGVTDIYGEQVLAILAGAREAGPSLGTGYRLAYAHFTWDGQAVPAAQAIAEGVVTATLEARITEVIGVYQLTMRFEVNHTPVDLLDAYPQLLGPLYRLLSTGDGMYRWQPNLAARNNGSIMTVAAA